MPPLVDFLDQFAQKRTRAVYRAHLFAYLDAQYGRQREGKAATTDEIAHYETLAARYLEDPEPVNDLARFVVALNHIPPTTASLRFSVVVDWLGYHGHEITARQRKVLIQRLPRGGTQTIEDDLDRETLGAILQQLDVRGRAIVLTLASSGMRIGELLQIPMQDVDLGASPATITLRGVYTKTGEPRITFCSSEAATALRAWLTVRDQVVSRSFGRHATLVSRGHPEKVRDDRLFPFSQHTIGNAWKLALEKCGIKVSDPTTNRTTLHLHMLRKFFHSQMKLGCPEEVVEALMGHSGYLSGAYRRYTKKQLGEYYAKAEQHVIVMVPPELLDIQGRVQDQLKAHNEIAIGQAAQIIELRSQQAALQREMGAMRQLVRAERVQVVARELEKE